MASKVETKGTSKSPIDTPSQNKLEVPQDLENLPKKKKKKRGWLKKMFSKSKSKKNGQEADG